MSYATFKSILHLHNTHQETLWAWSMGGLIQSTSPDQHKNLVLNAWKLFQPNETLQSMICLAALSRHMTICIMAIRFAECNSENQILYLTVLPS